MTTPFKVAFTGYYGMQNFGDDLFGMVCTDAARKWWNATPTLIGPSLKGVHAASTTPPWLSSAVYGAPGLAGKTSRYLSFRRGVAGTDVLVLGGGSVINARESFRKPIMLRAHQRGMHLAAVGVSIGPLPDQAAERPVAQFLDLFDYISVRDRRSYDLAVRMGVGDRTHAGRDLAGLLSPNGYRGRGNGIPTIGVAPCNYVVRDYPAPVIDAWQSAVVEAIVRRSHKHALRVMLFSLNEHGIHGDLQLVADLQRQLTARGIDVEHSRYAEAGPAATVRSIAQCDAMISARLHGAIVAYMQGVPFTIVDYHAKCRDFSADIGLPAERLIQRGKNDVGAFDKALASMLDSEGTPAVSPAVYAHEARQIFQGAPWSRT